MIQKLAWIVGVVLVAIGLLGFVPPLTPGGFLFDVFWVDLTHNLAYLVSGALALLSAWSGKGYARLYFKVFGLLFTAATIAGFLSGSVFGIMTVNASENILHLLLAIVALWAGFGAKEEVVMTQSNLAM